MKKSLLLASALLFGASAFAANAIFPKDLGNYEVVDGIKCYNVWETSRANYKFSDHYLATNFTYIRTATIWGEAGNEKIVFAWSKPYSYETGEVDSVGNPVVETQYNGTLVFMNFYTGEMEKEVTLKYNDEPITGLLCTNSIGVDDAGNLWVGSYVGATENDATPLKLHVVTDPENGICGTRWDLALPANEASTSGRIDYCDVAGDITGETMDGLCMASLNATANYMYRWRLFQGDVEWMGDFDGYVCWDLSSTLLETYPADVTAWSTSGCAIVYDADAAWEYFYVDGFNTCPSLYSIDRSYVDGFSNATDLSPAVGTVGITEFSIDLKSGGKKNFIAYSKNYYSSTPGCQVGIAEVGPNYEFEGMTEYWLLPENGLGTTTDGGTRIHSIATFNVQDANGNNGVYLLSYKANNGIAVYIIAEEAFEDNSVEGVEIDNSNVPAKYYNLQGMEIANPENGIYLVKRGNNVTKELVK